MNAKQKRTGLWPRGGGGGVVCKGLIGRVIQLIKDTSAHPGGENFLAEAFFDNFFVAQSYQAGEPQQQ